MAKLKLGLIVGSNRKESINRKLALALAKLGADAFEAKLIQIDDLPMYNEDFEAPLPAPVARFKSEVEASDALLVVSPEHGRSIPAVLKNAIDWGARPWGKTSWPDKPAVITGTSGGALSTALVQQHLRSVLGDQGLHLLGGEAYIQYKPDLIDSEHNVTDASVRDFLKALMDRFAVFAGKLAAA
ncbi:NADPH-dependent FMN reductase [Pseudolabrys sp. FHR47]|uniref:NADPH-dependent FMN reductase n=1 Tax=Pseudolabrys sp. FHR47 TaxID=2562284 RepID=UPI0010BF5053|nr:NADPH-dependent FMN reductase [Pseudolabrys sp. FHR47]